MKTPTSHSEDNVLLHSQKILARLLDQIWLGLLLLAIFAGISSVMRSTVTGWLPIYSLHLSIAIFICACYGLRTKLSFDLRVGILLTVFYLIGIAGLYSFGLLGAGTWWLVLTALLAKVFYSLRTGLIHAAVCFLLIVAGGIAYTSGLLTLEIDYENYLTSVATWATLIFGCVFISLCIFAALTTYQRTVLQLLRDMAADQGRIEAKTEEINRLKGMLPICAQCKKIRDDQGFWANVEDYIEKNSEATFSHCMCPDCGKAMYGETWDRAQESLDDHKND